MRRCLPLCGLWVTPGGPAAAVEAVVDHGLPTSDAVSLPADQPAGGRMAGGLWCGRGTAEGLSSRLFPQEAPAGTWLRSFAGTTVEGKPFSGASLAGKPTVLWFWAPWCFRYGSWWRRRIGGCV
jgi:hypothetical protein